MDTLLLPVRRTGHKVGKAAAGGGGGGARGRLETGQRVRDSLSGVPSC